MDHYHVCWIKKKKFFDTVNQADLYKMLAMFGCLERFIKFLLLFHDNMKALVNVDGKLSKPIYVDNDAK